MTLKKNIWTERNISLTRVSPILRVTFGDDWYFWLSLYEIISGLMNNSIQITSHLSWFLSSLVQRGWKESRRGSPLFLLPTYSQFRNSRVEDNSWPGIIWVPWIYSSFEGLLLIPHFNLASTTTFFFSIRWGKALIGNHTNTERQDKTISSVILRRVIDLSVRVVN